MASPPPRKESKIHWLKVPRRIFNQARNAISPNSHPHSPSLPETSTPNINIPNDDPGVVRNRRHAIYFLTSPSSSQLSSLLGTDSADRVEGNQSQDTNFTTSQITSEKIKKAWDVTRSGLLTALRVLEKSAGAFPPLKSAVGGLVACLDLAQVSHGCVFNTLCV